MLVRGGRLIDPAVGHDGFADVLVVDGLVAAVGHDLVIPDGTEVIEADGLIVAPGFVDLHTHLRVPGQPEKETMASGTAAAAAGGFTTVCAMANTRPVVDNPAILSEVLAEAAADALVHMYQLAAVSHGLAGNALTDFAVLAAAGAVAFSDDGKPVGDTGLMRAALEQARRVGRPISVHEEDPAIVGAGVANEGEPARRAGLPPWPCRGETSLVLRDLRLLAETGGRLHIAHVSCAETVRVLRAAKAEGLPVTAEVTPHHLRLTDALLDGNDDLGLPPAHPCVKVNPPLRSAADVEAVVEALADGTIDAVATDHAPHSAADKNDPFASAAFGFTGIELALPLVLDLVRAGTLSLFTAIQRLTIGPARAFGLNAATLALGAPADLCLFDPDEEWTVRPEALRSRGKNTPLMGARLRGRVRRTLVGGQTVYTREPA